MKQVIFIFLAIIPHLLSAQEIGYPFIRNYTSKEYNSSPQIWAITQDSKGVLYFGVGEGILEFDGVKWRAMQMPNKAATRCLAIDAKDRIFVGGIDELGYLETDKQGKKEFVSLKGLISQKDFKFSNVWHCKIWHEKVYFLTSEAIFEYSEFPNPYIKTYYARKGNQLSGLAVYGGKAYAYESNRGLVCTGKDSLDLVSDFYKDKLFWIALPFQSDSLLIIPNQINQPYIYNLANANSTMLSIRDTNFMLDNGIYTAALLPKQQIALGSFNKGLSILSKEGKKLQNINENNLLQNNTVFTIYHSPKQHLWLGLGNGISRTESNTALTYWDKKSGLNGTVTDILRFENRLYIATTNAVYYLENGQVQEIKGIMPGQCWDLLEYNISNSSEKVLLVGTQSGIYQIKGQKASLIYGGGHALKLASSTNNPNRLFSTDNTYFISLLYQKGSWIKEGVWENITENEIYEIQEDAKGELWLGTINAGVIRIKPDYEHITKPKKVSYYTEKDGLPSLRMIYPYKIKNKLVFATEKGLYCYNSKTDRFEPYCGIDKRLCQQDILEIYENKEGGIWTLPFKNNNHNISYLKPNNKGIYEYIYKPFRRMPEMEMECFYEDADGVAWFGSSEGLFRYDQKEDSKNYEQDFYTLIRKVTDGRDSVISYGSDISQQALDYNNNSLKFEFAAPFFDAENKTVYSYQLVGFEKDWSNWSSDTYATYTNLNEGSYTFQVKAKNIYDKESKISIYQLSVLPPYYRTWWAYLLYSIFSFLLMLLIVRLNSRRLEKEKNRLEGTIKERTQEIIEKGKALEFANHEIKSRNEALQLVYEEIQVSNEELQQSQEELVAQRDLLQENNYTLELFRSKITSSIRSAYTIQQAILPPKAKLDEILGEYFILNRPKDHVSGDFYWVNQIGTKKFIIVADCTGHGVSGAFMTMIGNTLLDKIIKVWDIYDPAQILDTIHTEIQAVLQQSETGNTDGMDVAVAVLEESENPQGFKVEFGGAKRPLYYIETGQTEVQKLLGVRKMVGGFTNENKYYQTESAILAKGSMIYMASDGYADQNDQNRHSFSEKRFMGMLSIAQEKTLLKQKSFLEHALDKHMAGTEQRDDILVLGLRV